MRGDIFMGETTHIPQSSQGATGASQATGTSDVHADGTVHNGSITTRESTEGGDSGPHLAGSPNMNQPGVEIGSQDDLMGDASVGDKSRTRRAMSIHPMEQYWLASRSRSEQKADEALKPGGSSGNQVFHSWASTTVQPAMPKMDFTQGSKSVSSVADTKSVDQGGAPTDDGSVDDGEWRVVTRR
ncbi:hypothetical protein IAT40_000690 [Kwoniella sp. CBS 6097]